MSAIGRFTISISQAAIAAFSALFLVSAAADAMEIAAKQAIIIDVKTGTVLLDKDPDGPMPPASMSKLMTLYMVFERLKDGRLSLDDKFLVSEKAWRMGGSKMFVEVNKRVRVEDLLRGIIVQSGNDACIVVAEGLAGSESAFAEEMNRKAREIGLTRSTFKNATGWPADGHEMSPRDLAILAQRVITEFPTYYRYFAEKSYRYNKIKQGNRNPLLYRDVGADGLKTGHTEASGYGLVGSAIRDGRRVVVVVNGLPSARSRSAESLKLIDWAFRSFKNYTLFKSGTVVEQADVWLGEDATVPLVLQRDVEVTLPIASRRDLKVKIVYDAPVPAPITKGAPIARMVVAAPNFKTLEVPLYAGAAVTQLGLFGRFGAAINYMIWGSSG